MEYTIKQFAEKFSVSEHTVRYYTDIGLLPCRRGSGNRRVFDDESVNWMQGISCLKGCGASIEDIKEYCRLCLLPESEETFMARRSIILKQRDAAYRRLSEAQETVRYMEEKVRHYDDILAGIKPDDSNPNTWREGAKPERHL